MGGSIHIHGTTSSIIDTVFVCRSSGATPEGWLFDTPERLIEFVGEDLTQLASTGRTPTYGDTRCILLGHLTRMAIWTLRDGWDRTRPHDREARHHPGAHDCSRDPDELARRVPPPEPLTVCAAAATPRRDLYGFRPIPAGGAIVTNEFVDKLRKELEI